MKRLQDKVAVITGAGNGIGAEAASLFAGEGAMVVVADIAGDAARGVCERIRARGDRALAVTVDVTEAESVKTLMDATVEAFGTIDVLYNNAGGSRPGDGTVVEVEMDVFWRTIKVDLLGTFLGCKFAIPWMRKAGGGAIVNMVSSVALMGTPGVDCYTAAKGGVAALTRSMAVTYAADGIRVNAIAPTTTLTQRIIEKLKSNPTAQRLSAKNLLGEPLPVDIAHAALFLASADARMTTGSIFPVDSGTLIY
ncbi:SDR family oxidoreductase [Castellaniella sp. GW247-6E4]|uniref:SDR family NAD(P)-dependent oxidoreductase n=1 Tax=Castellaniella sp. GW247-6E4 TaxID=3140380 RepID=UPI003315A9FE